MGNPPQRGEPARERKVYGKRVVASLLAGVLLAIGHVSDASSFPDKPISYVIPFGPGGESDITARHQQPFFKEKFGQDLVISYKPGGGGAVGWAQLNTFAGDGYTIMGINLPHIIVKPLEKDVGFQTQDITAIYMFHYTPDAVAVSRDSPFETLEDLITFAKDNPGKLTFSGSGKATANHLAHAMFDKLAEIRTTYMPFKGTGAAVQALEAGAVMAQWGYTSVGATHPKEVRLLAVATPERHPKFPDVPTFRELGFDIVSGAYRGIAVPKSTPEDVRRDLSRMIGEINADPDFQQRMIDDGMALLDVDYDGMSAFISEKMKEYEAAAREAGVIQ